ncbi:retrovirus-related pol polyprotein from transposon TNT 1-94 [Tanacetum coccineum]
MTDVKLVKDLHTSNFDQLHAYLKQHELHANEVRIMRERNQDPLAFVANQQMTPPHFNTYQSSYNNPQLQQQFLPLQQFSPSQHASIQPNQHYLSHYPSQTQFNHSSIPPSHTLQSQMNHQISIVPQLCEGSLLPIINSELPLIQETKPLFKMAGLQCNKFKEDKGKIILPKRPRNAAWYKEKAMLSEAQEAGQILDEEQLAFLVDPGIPASQTQTVIPYNAAFQTEDLDTYDSDCDDLSSAQVVLMANISNYGSDVILEAQQDSMILSVIEQMSEQMINHVNNWEKANKEQNNESITDELERYKEMVKTFEQRLNIDLSSREKMIDSQMDDMIREKLALKEQIDSLEQNLSKQIKEKESLFKTFIIKPTLYDGVVISKTHVAMPMIDDEETLILEEESRLKMFENAKDPEVIAKKISHKPIDYDKLNSLIDDFEKSFTPQQELSAEQAFWFHTLNPTIKPSYSPPVIVDVPIQTVFDQIEASVQQFSVDKKCLEIATKEILLENDRLLQKVMSQDILITVMNSMSLNVKIQKCELCKKCLNLDAELSKSKQAYNDLLKNHSQLEKHCISLEESMQFKQEVFQNNESCVNQNAVEIQEYFEINDLKARLQDKDTTMSKLKDTIKSLKMNTKENNVHHDKCDLEPINDELENSVAKLLSENEQLWNEINHVKQVFKDQFDSIKQTRARHKEQCDSLINKLNLKYVENEDLKAQIQDKVFVITSLKNNLRKLKGKEIVENVVHIPYATTIAPGMFMLDLVLLPPRLLQNRKVHINYLRNTQEQANILREIVKQVKAKKPLDGDLDLACKYATRIQELLVYVQDTCPNAITPSTKKVAVTPMNNVKKVRLAEPLTSSSNIKQVESSNTSDSNTPVLSSTRVKCSTSICRSKPLGNKGLMDMQTTTVVKPVCDVDVKQSLSNANSDILCATCNKSMFDGVHDKCLLDLVQNGNNHAKSSKKHKKQNIWKPTGHVFTEVGFKWKPTGRTFTIVGNSCPLTRFTSTNVVQIKLWYLDSGCLKHMTGNRSQLMNFVSKFLGSCDTNLYTISLDDMLKSSLIRLLSKASKTKSWLWHRRLSHLNFACALGKSKKTSHQPKAEDTNQEKLYLLHMDLCGQMRVASINGKRYILVIVDDYSRFTCVRFLKTKYEAPAAII